MYLGVDIGGTKTLVASLDDNGVIQEEFRFPTPKMYADFLKQLAENVAKLSTKDFVAGSVGMPGRVDRTNGVGVAFGNLPWRNVPLRDDLKDIAGCPTLVENDAKLAGLSEAQLLKEHEKVLYVTIGTGIGVALTVGGQLDPAISDIGGKEILLEHGGKTEAWEEFASGKAIVRQFGKEADAIDDPEAWKAIAHSIAEGLLDLIALFEPDIVVLGGGVSTHFDKFGGHLQRYLEHFKNPMLTIPPVHAAARPEQAVIYGCYDLARSLYGPGAS